MLLAASACFGAEWKPIEINLSNGGTGNAIHSGRAVKGSSVDFVFAESLRGRKVTLKVTSPSSEALLSVEQDGKEVIKPTRETTFVGSNGVGGYIIHVGTFSPGTAFRLEVNVAGESAAQNTNSAHTAAKEGSRQQRTPYAQAQYTVGMLSLMAESNQQNATCAAYMRTMVPAAIRQVASGERVQRLGDQATADDLFRQASAFADDKVERSREFGCR